MSEAALTVSSRELRVGDTLPECHRAADEVQLMLYNAALWNAHRIHFDHPWATEVEGYPALVLAGPLLGDWLHQCLEEWLGEDGMISSISYSNRVAAFAGETLVAGGTVSAVDAGAGEVTVDLYLRNQAGENTTPGVATVRLHRDRYTE